ncbi:FadR family transcriptional regulator [Fodinisporobacter ferrooxydans]|uniref:FadR family transcriptional regulator n=1 Tax=Fodinisporobacter ferrooxydans TaxID=2901836 RepID=A0ABY4CL47_9BACL|nr:FadR family transcriptional regulator [Alicyclobacillaceae bacterium MYW30-H2]
MEVKKIRSKKIYEQVADQIRQMIAAGELKPGDKLPPLKELSVQFGVSRATVREAFSALQGMGLIDLRHGEGTFVHTVDVERITQPMNAAFLLGVNHMNELMDVCFLMETGIAKFAAERRNEEDLSKLAQMLFNLEIATDPEIRAREDIYFHIYLAEATHNSIFMNYMSIIAEPLRSVIQLVHNETQYLHIVLKQLQDIYDAVKRQQPNLAEQTMREYLQVVHKNWLTTREKNLNI